MRSYAQIPARVKYFFVLDTVNPATDIFSPSFTYRPAIILPSLPSPVQTEEEFISTYSDPSGYSVPEVLGGQILKDLGQQFIITDPNYNQRAIYRRVQKVNGINSEGVGGSRADGWGTFYVKVWDSDPASTYLIVVTRTG
jgi:hypothetical protein